MSRISVAVWLVTALGTAGVAPTAKSQSSPVPPREDQIASAVLALPTELRASATVLGYNAQGKLETLRNGSGTMTCLASDPKSKTFHAACYHKSLEPFMARGRELRAKGVKDAEVDSVRFREVKAGTLKLPAGPASLYQIFGGTFDPKTGTLTDAKPPLFVVYIPFATAATTGLSARPVEGAPWIMFSGTPKAHIMFVPKM